jgi:hypothetical protein
MTENTAPETTVTETPLTLSQYLKAGTSHAACDHQSTKKARANCRKIRSTIAGFTPLTDEELSAAMRAGTKVTGWAKYDDHRLPEGVVLREITGQLDYVQDSKSQPGKRLWRIAFQIDPNAESAVQRALYSSSDYLTGNIRLAD